MCGAVRWVVSCGESTCVVLWGGWSVVVRVRVWCCEVGGQL